MTTDLVMALAYAPARVWSPGAAGGSVAEELADARSRQLDRSADAERLGSRWARQPRQWGGNVRS